MFSQIDDRLSLVVIGTVKYGMQIDQAGQVVIAAGFGDVDIIGPLPGMSFCVGIQAEFMLKYDRSRVVAFLGSCHDLIGNLFP